MKTFEEWLETTNLRIESVTEIMIAKCAWQACAAEYQQREADGPTPLNFYRGGQNSREREISELKAIIDEARKLAERWKITCRAEDFDSEEHPVYMVDSWLDHAAELLSVLDRSGARGGSGAEKS